MSEPSSPSARQVAADPSPIMRLGDLIRDADRRLYRGLRMRARWLKHERQAQLGVPLKRKLGMWGRGFFAESAVIYDFPRNDPSEYLSDYQHFVRCGKINAWDELYMHKLALRSLLLSTGFRQAETVALIHGGRILAQPFGSATAHLTGRGLLERLAGYGDGAGFIVKPEDGWCGEDIFLLTVQGDGFVRQRGREVAPFDLEAFVARLSGSKLVSSEKPPATILIERRLQQGAFWSDLFPGSANTIRALTLWIPGEPAPFLARAVQRVGTADTVPTDNWSGGGISALIDPSSGRLGVGRMHPLKGRRAGTLYQRHPDTGALLEGAVIPGWKGIVETVLRAASGVPFNPMAGWDILVDADGVPVLLEANGNSDVNLLQVHGGLLSDPRVRSFYEATGVVAPQRNAGAWPRGNTVRAADPSGSQEESERSDIALVGSR